MSNPLECIFVLSLNGTYQLAIGMHPSVSIKATVSGNSTHGKYHSEYWREGVQVIILHTGYENILTHSMHLLY